MSEESRYRRFLHPIEHLNARDLAYLTEVDHRDHEALIAIDAQGEAAGVARYIRGKSGSDEAEFAIAVVDDWQGRGLGTELLVRLMERARAAGVRRFTALVLSDNREAIELVEHIAPEVSRRSSSGVMELVIELPERPQLITAELRGADGSVENAASSA